MKKIVAMLCLLLAACSAEPLKFAPGTYEIINFPQKNGLTINFSEDGKVNGKVVNYYMGNYELKENNGISLRQIGATMMMGPENEMKAEPELLQQLEKIKSYEVQEKYLVLKDSDGLQMILKPLK